MKTQKKQQNPENQPHHRRANHHPIQHPASPVFSPRRIPLYQQRSIVQLHRVPWQGT